MFDATAEPAVSPRPAARQAASARPIPPRIAELLPLLHIFIAYGKTLAETLQRNATAPQRLPWFWFVARAFGSIEIPHILARITRGLLRTAALEAKLRRMAAHGRDLPVASSGVPSPRKPRAAAPATPPAEPAPLAQDPDRLPTPQEIEAEVRRRSVGAVLIDICHDLGIASPPIDRAARQQLRDAILMNGGDLVHLLSPKEDDELYNPSFPPIPDPLVFPPWPAASLRPPSPAQPLASVPAECPPPPTRAEAARPPPPPPLAEAHRPPTPPPLAGGGRGEGTAPGADPPPRPPTRHETEPRAPSEPVGLRPALCASTALTPPSPDG